MPAESDLHKALAAVGESAPERPLSAWMGASAAVNALAGHVKDLESLALRLAVRLEMAERGHTQVEGAGRCSDCEGWGRYRCDACYSLTDKCLCCKGTGKEQGR